MLSWSLMIGLFSSETGVTNAGTRSRPLIESTHYDLDTYVIYYFIFFSPFSLFFSFLFFLILFFANATHYIEAGGKEKKEEARTHTPPPPCVTINIRKVHLIFSPMFLAISPSLRTLSLSALHDPIALLPTHLLSDMSWRAVVISSHQISVSAGSIPFFFFFFAVHVHARCESCQRTQGKQSRRAPPVR